MNNTKLFCTLYIPQFSAQAIAVSTPLFAPLSYAVTNQNVHNSNSFIYSCSPTASHEGVEPGMYLHSARKYSPHLIILPRDNEREKLIKQQISDVLYTYTPSFTCNKKGTIWNIDLSNTPLSKQLDSHEVGIELHKALKEETLLETVILGLGTTELISKIMVKQRSIDGVSIDPENGTIAKLSSHLLPNVTQKSKDLFKKYGLTTIGMIQQLSKSDLRRRFSHEGERIYGLVHGFDLHIKKQSNKIIEETFHFPYDSNDLTFLDHKISLTVDRLCFKLHKENNKVTTITCEITYIDRKKSQRSMSYTTPTNNFTLLKKSVTKIFTEIYTERRGLKSIKIHGKCTHNDVLQEDLFHTTSKQDKLYESMNTVRRNYTFSKLVYGKYLV